jgi:adenosylhomocysteine nucleosidase
LNPPPLITFAVRAEAAPAQRLLRRHSIPAQFLLTGIGSTAATKSVAPALASRPPLVLSCGFAGGLNRALPAGALVADVDPGFPLRDALTACGAQFVIFLNSNRILTTVQEKAAARAHSHADAVDMESTTVRQLCLKAEIPSATLRVISDAADEELPLDFNRFVGHSGRFRYDRLMLALLRSPGRVRSLIRFQRQTRSAAAILAAALASLLSR